MPLPSFLFQSLWLGALLTMYFAPFHSLTGSHHECCKHHSLPSQFGAMLTVDSTKETHPSNTAYCPRTSRRLSRSTRFPWDRPLPRSLIPNKVGFIWTGQVGSKRYYLNYLIASPQAGSDDEDACDRHEYSIPVRSPGRKPPFFVLLS